MDILEALLAAAPFSPDEDLKVVCLGAQGDPQAAAVRARFPRATLKFVERDLATLDWWDVMFGADLVVSSMTLHDLSDAKKQYLYKAAADRLSPRGAFLIADALEPGQLLHHLMWLRHAGFAVVDCFWRNDRVAIFGGLRQAAASARPLPAGS